MALFDNVVACYQFEKSSKLGRDSGPYANHGYVNGTTITQVASGVTNLGYAARFAGGSNSEYIHIPSHAFNELWKTCAVSICFRMNSLAQAGNILTKTDASTTYSCGLRIGSGVLSFSEGNTNKWTNLESYIPADGNFHFLTVSCDAGSSPNATATLFIDGSSIGTSLLGWHFFADAHNLRIGAAENNFFGSNATSASFDVAEVVFWNKELSLSDHQAWRNSGAGTSFNTGTIVLDEIGDYRVIQRDKDGSRTKVVSRSGYYTGADPHSIEIATYDWTTTTTLVQDWTAGTNLRLNTTTKEWSANFSLPQHTNWCRYKVRSKNPAGTVIETSDLTIGKVGVGVVAFTAGQSNMAHMFDWYSTTWTNSKASIFYSSVWGRSQNLDGTSWDYIGAGANILTNKLQTAFGCPVGFIVAAVGGTGLYQADGGGYWLDNSTSGVYTQAIAKATLAGGDFELVLWHQGEADAHSGVSVANHKAALTTLYSRLQAYTGRDTTQLFMGVGSIGPLSDGSTAANIANMRYAAESWARATPGAFYMGSNVDATLTGGDNYHYVTGSYQRCGYRWSNAVMDKYGIGGTPGGGPLVTNAWWLASDKKVRLVVDKRFLTALKEVDGTTDGGSLTGFEVSTNNFSTTETINATAFSGGNTIELTVNTLTTGQTVYVRYQQAAVPTITNPAYGNLLPQADTIGYALRSILPSIIAKELTAAPTAPATPLISVTTPLSFYPRTL